MHCKSCFVTVNKQKNNKVFFDVVVLQIKDYICTHAHM